MVCEELFGTVAEEKTIQGITVKLHEAKSKKSNDIIEILATFVTSGSFVPMIRPLKEVGINLCYYMFQIAKKF